MHGDELRIRWLGDPSSTWSCAGQVIKIPDTVSDEVGLELKTSAGAPTHLRDKFVIDFVWKSTSFDRMQAALRKFAMDGELHVSVHLQQAVGTH